MSKKKLKVGSTTWMERVSELVNTANSLALRLKELGLGAAAIHFAEGAAEITKGVLNMEAPSATPRATRKPREPRAQIVPMNGAADSPNA